MGLPTSGRFVFYELDQRGGAKKPDPDDTRMNRRRSIGWPPGSQDVIAAEASEGECSPPSFRFWFGPCGIEGPALPGPSPLLER
jgi:hypothetical protein